MVTVPLVLLAIPSVGAGLAHRLRGLRRLLRRLDRLVEHKRWQNHGAGSSTAARHDAHAALPFWLALAGIATAWYLYMKRTDLPKKIAMAFGPLYALVESKYGFDELYSWLFAQRRARRRHRAVEGRRPARHRRRDGQRLGAPGRLVLRAWCAWCRAGCIYWYAFTMIFGVCAIYAVVKYRLFT